MCGWLRGGSRKGWRVELRRGDGVVRKGPREMLMLHCLKETNHHLHCQFHPLRECPVAESNSYIYLVAIFVG